MTILRYSLPLLMANSLFANKALDLLDAEPTQPGEIYQTIGGVAPSAKSPIEKPPPPPEHPAPPERWPKEVKPLVTYEMVRKNPYLQEIALRGNFDYQLHSGSEAQDSGLRRSHLGIALRAFYDLEIEADAAFDSSGDYLGFETLRAKYAFHDKLALSVGKFRPSFSSEYSTDPSLRWFPDLSPLLAQLAPASSLGALLEGQGWKLGYFSGDSDRNIPDIDGRGFLLAGLEHRGWHLDYIHNFDRGRSEAIPLAYRHLFSTGVKVSSGSYDFASEFFLAKGDENTSWGVTLRAARWLVQDAFRLVGRYHYAASDQAGGILSGFGVARPISDVGQPFQYNTFSTADSLHSFYLGVNAHFFEDNLLWGAGLEYRTLSGADASADLDSWNWSTHARLAF